MKKFPKKWTCLVLLCAFAVLQGSLCQFNLATTCGSHLQCRNNGTCDYTANNYNNLTAGAGTGMEGALVGHCMCLPGFTGFHCEIETVNCSSSSDACLNGECVFDNSTLTEHCQCEPGFMGKFCQIDIDECASTPCHNEGVCLDKINGFDCACPFGYTGRLCENKLKICDVNPCIHGFCLEEEENKKTCYCVPDFHGDLCELQYNECEPEPQCHNGGTCIDGVGGFNCSCPPTHYGPICQCTTANASHNISAECQAFLDNTTTTVSTSSLWWMPPTPTPTITTTLFHSESQGSEWMMTATMIGGSLITEIEMTMTAFPGYSTTRSFYYESPEITATIRSELALTTRVEGGELPATMLSPGPSQPLEPSIEIMTLTGRLDPTVFEPIPDITATPAVTDSFVAVSTPSPTEEVNETSTVLFTMISTIELVSTAAPVSPQTPMPTATLPASAEAESTATSPPILQSPTPPLPPDYDDATATLAYSTPGIVEPSEGTVLPSGTHFASGMTTNTATASLIFTPGPISGQATPTPSSSVTLEPPLPESSAQRESSQVSHYQQQQESTQFPVIETTEIEVGTMAPAPTATAPVSTPIIILPTKSVSEPTESASSAILFPSSPTPRAPTTEEAPITTSESAPAPENATTPSTTDPCQDYCHNNAKCTYSEARTPVCRCPFKYAGEKCEQLRGRVSTPSFSGNSFLAYNLSREEPNTLIDSSLTVATLIRNGLLLYTGVLEGLTYALIYVQDGHICLHFSCGEQSMSFIETRTRIDTGFNFTLNFKMEMLLSEFNEIHCSCRLTVNGSYTMGGEQLVGKESFQFPRNFPKLFLGGVDPDLKETQQKHDEMIGALDGFRGCLYQLMLDKVKQDMYEAAVDGQNIGECSNFVCTINPCFGESICIPSHQFPQWECKCPPLFEGVRCQIPICSHNPCLNDGQCTASVSSQSNSNSTQEIAAAATTTELTSCNCRLGFTGPACESRTNVTQPSFRPKPNYGSYISYNPMLNLKDWFQLKFHFLTKNMTQFGLVLFIGGRNPYYYHYGHSVAVEMEHHQSQQDSLQVESPLQPRDGNPNTSETALNEITQEDSLENAKAEAEAEEPDQSLDFFAISFLQGYLAVTWNLGSGVQRIVTPHRIDTRLSIHTLYTGRAGSTSWLKVDGMGNVSGTSPGKYKRLDTGVSELFVGGYETFRMEGLPYDLSLHEGFEGCIFDLGFRVKNKLFLPTVTSGRNVGNCFSDYYTRRKR